MRDSKEIKADLIKMMELSSDELFREYGFKRRKGSLSYIRNLGDAKQTIVFDTDCFPKYQPDAEVHIYPAMQLSIKTVSDVAMNLVDGNRMLLANAPDRVFNQPIDITAPKEYQVRWFASGPLEISQKILEIASFAEKWVIPFFDELQTPGDLVKVYANDDGRILKQRHWYLFVASAAIVQGDKSEALTILEDNFGSPGLRKRYSVIFDSLNQK